jgi:hypothetical protein|tara:strand:+ start:60 stop:1040 length:981 start_codon:yes stop_codon:yes gene_type:complete
MVNLEISAEHKTKLIKKKLNHNRRPEIQKNSFPLYYYDFTKKNLNNLAVNAIPDDALHLYSNNPSLGMDATWFKKHLTCVRIRKYSSLRFTQNKKIQSVKQMTNNGFSFSMDFMPPIARGLRLDFWPIHHDSFNYVYVHLRNLETTMDFDITVHIRSRTKNADNTWNHYEEQVVRFIANKFYETYNVEKICHFQLMFNINDTSPNLACSTSEKVAIYLDGIRLPPYQYRFKIQNESVYTLHCKHEFGLTNETLDLDELVGSKTDSEFWNESYDSSLGEIVGQRFISDYPNYYNDDNLVKFIDVPHQEINVYKINAYNSAFINNQQH